MIGNIAFWSIVIACGAAYDMYDENRPFRIDQNGDVLYNQEQNYDYQEFGPYPPEFRADPAHSLMLYQLFNSLQNGDDDRLQMRFRPKLESPLSNYGQIPYSEVMDPKRAVSKRTAISPGSSVNANEHQVKPINHPTKVQGKTIRKGPNWVCYLKVCAYRFPK
nr:uncharacterized protein LOC110380180 isoform X1 [Helicoverpa armigera]XP_049694109.1 uncharacterized protein LOC110380180 isoform X1 [Helicoverpa armigera]